MKTEFQVHRRTRPETSSAPIQLSDGRSQWAEERKALLATVSLGGSISFPDSSRNLDTSEHKRMFNSVQVKARGRGYRLRTALSSGRRYFWLETKEKK